MNRFALFAAVAVLSLQSSYADRLQLRPVVEQSATGAIELPQKDQPSKVIVVGATPIFTDADVENAEVLEQDGAYSIAVGVKLASQAGFEAAVIKLIGKSLAIIVDQQVISAPTVMSAFSTGFVISGNFTKAEAEELVAAFTPASQ